MYEIECPSCKAKVIIDDKKVPETELIPSDNKGVLLTITLPGANLTKDDCLKIIKELNDKLSPETE